MQSRSLPQALLQTPATSLTTTTTWDKVPFAQFVIQLPEYAIPRLSPPGPILWFSSPLTVFPKYGRLDLFKASYNIWD